MGEKTGWDSEKRLMIKLFVVNFMPGMRRNIDTLYGTGIFTTEAKSKVSLYFLMILINL